MKNLKLLALALVFGTSSLFAINTVEPNRSEKEMRTELVKLLQTPDFVVKEDMSVLLKFTFNSEGEIVVLCPGCKDEEIVNYIRENLNQKKFKNPGEKDKIYTIPLTIVAK
jgi:hypothetical protein